MKTIKERLKEKVYFKVWLRETKEEWIKNFKPFSYLAKVILGIGVFLLLIEVCPYLVFGIIMFYIFSSIGSLLDGRGKLQCIT